jgi:hypothetical protein
MFKFDFVDALDDELDNFHIEDEADKVESTPDLPESRTYTLSELVNHFPSSILKSITKDSSAKVLARKNKFTTNNRVFIHKWTCEKRTI